MLETELKSSESASALTSCMISPAPFQELLTIEKKIEGVANRHLAQYLFQEPGTSRELLTFAILPLCGLFPVFD